jgi:hypothetical protein
MADFLNQKRNEIMARLNELGPLVDEYTRLQAAADALDGVPSTPAQTPQRGSRHSATARPPRRGEYDAERRGRPKGSGTRSKEALQLVTANPGITILEIAEKISIKPNYLYRVLSDLADAGLVTKQDRGWYPNNSVDRNQNN